MGIAEFSGKSEMKLPKIRDLTDEQKKVYLYAPTDNHVLVHGPPGTGKTLIACLRAIELQKKQLPVVLGMFNRVLTRYSSNVGKGAPMPSQTVPNWFRTWWHASRLPPHPSTPKKIAVEVPFAEREAAKAAGATWHPGEWRPWGRGRGAWMVDFDAYAAAPDRFSSWRLWHQPPAPDGKSQGVDWRAVSEHLLNHEDAVPDQALNLGVFLIDEGQDFPEAFYKFLRQLAVLSGAPGRKVTHPLRCFVLADENQQITEENSTLEQIAKALHIEKKHQYLLLDNFRNSKEIAELARSFFADVGALPKLPTRRSEKPVYSRARTYSDVVNRIKIWITNNPHKEIGVLVFSENTRESICNELMSKLANLRGRNITVQTYSWNSRQENRVDDLIFDAPDVVTVLNMQSCKGLEFDAVFIIDLHEAQIGIYGVDRFKMQMFVAVSRGRDWVNLIDSGNQAGQGPYFDCLPKGGVMNFDDAIPRATENVVRVTRAPGTKKIENGTSKAVRSESAPRATISKDSHEVFLEIARQNRLKFDDNRAKGGAVWVSGGASLTAILEPLGFQYSQKRSGWWRK